MTSELAPAVAPVEAVLAALDLREVGTDRFAGDSLVLGMPRVFGGQVLAQALIAAARTVRGAMSAHSLHAYFLRAGDPTLPIEFQVTRVRDGRRLSVRTVSAHQGERVLATVTLSFTAPGSGVEHQVSTPATAAPDTLPTLADHARSWGGLSESWSGLDAIECRFAADAQQLIWQRIRSSIGTDPVLHQALLVFLSDVTTLAAALVQHGIPIGVEELDGRRWDGISLDHAVWFHRPVRADEWLLFAQSSPSAAHGRAFTRAEIFDAAGVLVASIAQEGLFAVGEK